MLKTRQEVKGLLPGAGPWLTRHRLGTRNLGGQVLDLPWAVWHGNPPAGREMGGKWTPRICTQVLKTRGMSSARVAPQCPNKVSCDSFQGGFLEEVAESSRV